MTKLRDRYKDPLYNLIYLNVDELNVFTEAKKLTINDTLREIVQTDSFKRLMNIKQLGVTYRIFPGAVHNRFLHSLGVFHLAKIALKNQNLKWTETEAIVFLFAALLHDIGHGPLSHSFEVFLGDENPPRWKHETNTLHIIQTDPEINSLLKKISHDLPDMLRQIFDDEAVLTKNKELNLSKVKKMISSEFDVDRLDYLHRDAFFAGAKYIFGEGELLLNEMEYDEHEETIYFAERFKNTYLYYLLTRKQMFDAVYLHAESILYDGLLGFLGKYIKEENLDYNQLCKILLEPNTYNFVAENKKNVHDDNWFISQLSEIAAKLKEIENKNEIQRRIIFLINAFIHFDLKNIEWDGPLEPTNTTSDWQEIKIGEPKWSQVSPVQIKLHNGEMEKLDFEKNNAFPKKGQVILFKIKI